MEALPAKELRQMLAVRGVSLGTATEKAELAKWAFQHQDLPATRSAESVAKGGPLGPAREATKSMVELERMSVAELREMLARRGVGEGSATEKGELVQWVWQHQNLPVLRTASQEKKTGRRGRRSFFGFGAESEPYDSPREEPRRSEERGPEKLEGESQERLEGSTGQQLLEGSTEAEAATSPARHWWPWAVGGICAAFAAAFGAVALNDALTAQPQEE